MTRSVTLLTADQWDVARDLRLASLQHDPDAFGASYDVEAAFTEEQWRDFVTRQDVLVVFDDDTPAAIAHVETFEGDFGATCWLGGCWVAPSARRTGAVRSLIEFMDARRDERGWHVLGLGVWENNFGAIAAYQQLGFVVTGDSVESTRRPPRRYVRMIRRRED